MLSQLWIDIAFMQMAAFSARQAAMILGSKIGNVNGAVKTVIPNRIAFERRFPPVSSWISELSEHHAINADPITKTSTNSTYPNKKYQIIPLSNRSVSGGKLGHDRTENSSQSRLLGRANALLK